MKTILSTLAPNIVALTCIVISGYLIVNDIKGWGWFLLAGVLCVGSASASSVINKKEEK